MKTLLKTTFTTFLFFTQMSLSSFAGENIFAEDDLSYKASALIKKSKSAKKSPGRTPASLSMDKGEAEVLEIDGETEEILIMDEIRISYQENIHEFERLKQ